MEQGETMHTLLIRPDPALTHNCISSICILYSGSEVDEYMHTEVLDASRVISEHRRNFVNFTALL